MDAFGVEKRASGNAYWRLNSIPSTLGLLHLLRDREHHEYLLKPFVYSLFFVLVQQAKALCHSALLPMWEDGDLNANCVILDRKLCPYWILVHGRQGPLLLGYPAGSRIQDLTDNSCVFKFCYSHSWADFKSQARILAWSLLCVGPNTLFILHCFPGHMHGAGWGLHGPGDE